MLYLLLRMISTKFIMRSMCLRADIMPTSRRRLNSRQCSDPVPPITSTNSCVSLKGDCSKPAGGRAGEVSYGSSKEGFTLLLTYPNSLEIC